MTKVFIYFTRATDKLVVLEMSGNTSKIRNDILNMMRTNEVFSIDTNEGFMILRSEEIAAIYVEKN